MPNNDYDIAGLKVSLGIQYRQLDGLLKKTMLDIKIPHTIPPYKEEPQRLISKLIGIVTFADKTKKIMLAVDATEIKQYNLGCRCQKSEEQSADSKIHVMLTYQHKR